MGKDRVSGRVGIVAATYSSTIIASTDGACLTAVRITLFRIPDGGAGTTAAGLRAGLPSVVVAFFADQPFWGWRVQQLGAGPKWIMRQKLTAANLAGAIRQAVSDEQIRAKAANIGRLIRAENGVQGAVDLVEQYAPLKLKWWTENSMR